MVNQRNIPTGGNKSAAARLLGISERHIMSGLERLDLE